MLTGAFKLSNWLRAGNQKAGNLCLLQGCLEFWNMPSYVFVRWRQLRCGSHKHGPRRTNFKGHQRVDTMVCRIVQDWNRALHMLPYVSLWVSSADSTEVPLQIIYFSCSRNPESKFFILLAFFHTLGLSVFIKESKESQTSIARY